MNSPISLLLFFNIASIWGVIYFIYIQPVAGSDPLETIFTLLYPSTKIKVVSSQVYSRNWRLKHFKGLKVNAIPKKPRTQVSSILLPTGNLSCWAKAPPFWMNANNKRPSDNLTASAATSSAWEDGWTAGSPTAITHEKERKMIDSPNLQKNYVQNVNFQGFMFF